MLRCADSRFRVAAMVCARPAHSVWSSRPASVGRQRAFLERGRLGGSRRFGKTGNREDLMRKTTLVLGLLAAVAVSPMAHAATTAYKASLSGATEVPPVTSAGKGAAAVNVDTATKQASWRVEYSGLSGPATAAHIHCGAAAGANAGVAVPLGNAAASPI